MLRSESLAMRDASLRSASRIARLNKTCTCRNERTMSSWIISYLYDNSTQAYDRTLVCHIFAPCGLASSFTEKTNLGSCFDMANALIVHSLNKPLFCAEVVSVCAPFPIKSHMESHKSSLHAAFLTTITSLVISTIWKCTVIDGVLILDIYIRKDLNFVGHIGKSV